jgi:methyl-accepting chemotaxis protein
MKMRMTISRKLICGFLSLALLVLLAGFVGIFVLNKVSDSADTVAKEKAPIQNAVMNGALAVDVVQKNTIKYTSAVSGLDSIAGQINKSMAEFAMWNTILQFGTTSDEFKNSPAYAVFQEQRIKLEIPRCSETMLPIVKAIAAESNALQDKTEELLTAHRQRVAYGVMVDRDLLSLPDFLNLAQRHYMEWTKQLKDAVNIETTFTGITDASKGLIGNWLTTYHPENKELQDTLQSFTKNYGKIMEMAAKINSLTTFKDKLRTLNRGIGITAKLERDFESLQELSNKIYLELDKINEQKQEEQNSSVEKINNQLHELIRIAGDEMHSALEETAKAKTQGVTFMIVLTVLAFVAAAVLGTVVSRLMSKNILSIAESTKKIAAGDLQNTIQIKAKDELGDLAHDTNAMITNLRSIIGQILSFSGKLTTSAEELTGISNDFDANAEQLNEKSNEAGTATSAMNNSMRDISGLANDSMERVRSVAIATEEMSSTIAEIAENAEQARSVTSKAVTTVENTSLKMSELSEAAKEIGKVAEVIVNIAEQTNLLSLNATIEAARAGEAGKGFAVVANEVKELAGQTNKATEDIRQRITAIQQSSSMAIDEITEISKIITDINAIVVVIAGAVEEQAATTKQITDDINSVSGGIEGMTHHVGSATSISESVVSDIEHVKTTSGSISEGSNYIHNKATELEKLASELNQLVSQFKL